VGRKRPRLRKKRKEKKRKEKKRKEKKKKVKKRKEKKERRVLINHFKNQNTRSKKTVAMQHCFFDEIRYSK